MYDDAPQAGPTDPADEASEPAVNLSWAFDTSLNNGLNIFGRIANGVELSVASMKALHENGVPSDMLSFDFKVGVLDSALIFSGLQVLGVLCESVRDDIADLILRFDAAQVPPTPEEQAIIEAASEKFADQHFGLADEVGPSEAASNN